MHYIFSCVDILQEAFCARAKVLMPRKLSIKLCRWRDIVLRAVKEGISRIWSWLKVRADNGLACRMLWLRLVRSAMALKHRRRLWAILGHFLRGVKGQAPVKERAVNKERLEDRRGYWSMLGRELQAIKARGKAG